METEQLRINVRNLELAVVLDLKGDLTKHAEETLLSFHRWEDGLAEGKANLVLNFTDVPYINSAGIAVLIRICRTGRKAGYNCFAFGLSSHYQKLFRMVGLTEYMMIYPNEFAVLQRIEDLYKMTE